MKKYRIDFVYNNLTYRQKQQIITMWLESGVLSRQVAEQRVDQVSTMIFDQDDQLIGVSTVYAADFCTPNNPYFFFRMFIIPSARGSNLMRTENMQLNFASLKNQHGSQAHGLVLELENPKLAALGTNSTYFSERGYTYQGKSARGLQLWYVRFDEPKGIFAGL